MFIFLPHILTLQIAALVQPEHMSATGRAVANLGRGMNSTGLVRLTNYQLSVGRLTRLLTRYCIDAACRVSSNVWFECLCGFQISFFRTDILSVSCIVL